MVRKMIIDIVEKHIREVIKKEVILQHHLRTRDYLLVLDPNASIEAQVAALTHDIERSLPNSVPCPTDKNDYNKEYLLAHGKRSTEYVIEFLKSKKIELDYNKLEKLITNHEFGGNAEANDLKDADTLSFLEVLPHFFLDKYGPEFAEHKFKYMLGRVTTDKAKGLSKPLYEKAMEIFK
jgi:hypothetical protein